MAWARCLWTWWFAAWFVALLAAGPVVGPAARAQSGEAPPEEEGDAEEDWPQRSWVILPSFFYTPETRLAGGVSVGYYYRPSAEAFPSSVQTAFIYTQRKQIIASVYPDVYFRHGRRHVSAQLLYMKYPDRFYGIGNATPDSLQEPYTSRIARARILAETAVRPRLRAGVLAEVNYETLTEVEGGGLLEPGTIPGSTEGTAVGLGVNLTWDARDDVYYTMAGRYLQVSWTAFGPVIGSSYTFSRAVLDARQFVPLGPGHALAFRLHVQGVTGTAPFQYLPSVGGRYLMRGYPQGRYRDNLLLTLQAEYRLHVWDRLSLAFFGSAGDVPHRFGDLFGEVLYSGGGGIRWRTADTGVNLRIDYGISPTGTGLYVTLLEAF